jgi:hypothetical protein
MHGGVYYKKGRTIAGQDQILFDCARNFACKDFLSLAK